MAKTETAGMVDLSFRGSGDIRTVSAMLSIQIEQEEDGRWIGEVPELPGVLVYAPDPTEARSKAAALALHVIADRIEHGEDAPFSPRDFFRGA
jgi:predicted RNase H-like HicB family nuclease